MRSLGQRVRLLRQQRGLTLQDLADAAHVSRSMISEVERGTKVPTVLVLDRIAGSLSTSIGHLLDAPRAEPVVVVPTGEQRAERDGTGWSWRVLSPTLPDHALQLVRGVAPAHVDGPEFPAHPRGAREWVAVERGRLEVRVAENTFELGPGDAIAYVADVAHQISNPFPDECVYYLVIDHPRPSDRRR